MSTNKISQIRSEYNIQSLNEGEVFQSPFKQFERWLNEAIESKCNEPTAMTFASSTFEGKPSARVLLLKEFSDKGFVFFTNYESKKGRQILQNPYGAIVFFWPELQRQVRLEGTVKKSSEEQSDNYFKTRPEKSKIGAWASPQSQVIPNRRYLENLKSDFQEEFSGKTISRPPNWGGYIFSPSLFEFWQGRPNRLHDRLQYTLQNEAWVIERLAP
jgi:pyridoxamine 5'-phosphate oxidase